MTEKNKRSKMVLAIAGTEIFIGLFLAVGITLMVVRQTTMGSQGIGIALSSSIMFILAGTLLWLDHRVGLFLSTMIQILCVPQINTPLFSWYVQVPINFTPKISQGSSYFGVNILAAYFAVVLIRYWRNQASSTERDKKPSADIGIIREETQHFE